MNKFRRLVLQKDLTADNIVKIKNSLERGSHPWIDIEFSTPDGLYQDYMFTPERMPWSKESKKHYRDRLYGWAYVHFMYIQESDDNEFTYYGMKYYNSVTKMKQIISLIIFQFISNTLMIQFLQYFD